VTDEADLISFSIAR